MVTSYNLESKNAQTVRQLAKYFISIDVGSRINTVSQFEQTVNSARGTIQNSLKILSDANAISLVPRGHLGTFLVSKNLSMLLQFADISFLIGVMPLPYSKIYEGLSTGLIKTMENKLNIPVNMAHMRGANQRIQMVLSKRYDFAVISKYAAQNYIKDNDGIEILIEFEPHSYLRNHVIMFSDPHQTKITENMRIGIDYDSIDQSSLTLEATKNIKVELIPTSYNQFVNKLINGEIDAAIWNGDEITHRSRIRNIQNLELDNKDNTIAVIVVNKDREELKSLIKELINIEAVQSIQKEVVAGKILPSY